MLTEGQCLAQYAKDKNNIVTMDASRARSNARKKIMEEQDAENTKPIAYESRYV